ncbi:MAG: UDP-2,3-diacylglucosamine diphosphatase [Candidatus Cloacimonetes bacterium]|nr:UDP-2,3-diacylglucosamine diphosphatase [Candidatus Cloacimonadota bacterium]
MKIICISDIHQKLQIDDEEKEKLKKLYSFLDKIKSWNLDKLIIAGDLFDVWYEYKMVIPKPYFTTLTKLKSISEKGIKIIYLAGNHDFKFRDFLQNEIQIEVYLNDYEFNIGNRKFFISHGDDYTSNDARYHFFKTILRNKFVNHIFGIVHPDLGLKFGKWMSRSSRKKELPQKKKTKLEKGLVSFSKIKFSQGFEYVIMGHIHQPRILTFDNSKYINLGDWIYHYSYLEIEDEKVELKYWK